MTRETKFGLLLVLTLTSVFGFLVWKKMHQPKDLVATTQATETAEGEGDTPPEELDPLANDGPVATPLAAIPPERPAPRRPVTPIDSTPNGDELFPGQSPVKTAARSKPKLPVDLDGQDFFTPPKAAAREPAVTETRTTATDPDPFAAPAETTVSTETAVPAEPADPFAGPAEPVTTAATADGADPDPFAEAVPVTAQTEPPVEVEPTTTPTGEPDPFTADRIEVPAREPVVLEMPAEPAEPVVVGEPQNETIELPAEVADPPTQAIELPPDTAAAAPTSEPDPFNDPVAEAPVEISARSASPTVPVEERAEPVIALPARAEPVTPPQFAAQQPDPFFADERTPEPTRAIPERQPPPRLRAPVPVSEPDPFGTPSAVPAIPARTEPVPVLAEPLPVRTESFPPRTERFPARAEPLPVRAAAEPLRTPARHTPPMSFSGETYIVQPNDNFWTISKKVYGSGRYFEALAKYNASLVADPAKMKPGLKIATPAAAELQTRYPQLLAAAGTQESVQDPASLGLPGDVYVAQSGDNFWEISKRLYGDGKYFRALEQHNSVLVNDTQKLQPGMKLAAPKAAWLHAKYPQLIASAAPAVAELRRTQPDRYQPDEPAGFFVGPGEQPMYRVGTRDTLGEIAQTYLGRSSRWIQIYNLNRDVLTDGNALNVGTVLKLPADASRVVLIEEGSIRR